MRVPQTYLGSIFIVCCILQLTYQQYRYYEAQEKPLPLASTVLPVSYAMLSALVGTYVSNPCRFPTHDHSTTS